MAISLADILDKIQGFGNAAGDYGNALAAGLEKHPGTTLADVLKGVGRGAAMIPPALLDAWSSLPVPGDIRDRPSVGASDAMRKVIGEPSNEVQSGSEWITPPQGMSEKLAALAASKLPAGALAAHLAYHGSPYTFSKFDWDKIGTGEGNQMIAYGHYLGDAEGTGRYYRDTLSATRPTTVSGGGTAVTVPHWLASKIKDEGIDSAISEWTARAAEQRDAMATSMQPWIAEGNATRIEGELAAMKQIKAAGEAKVEKPGKLYKVDINADPEHYLDWDKGLSEQSPHVKSALEASLNYKRSPGLPKLTLEEITAANPYATGETVYKMAGYGDPVKATEVLKQHGIPGVRYLDQNSRGPLNPIPGGYYANKGRSHNYVIFDDDLLNILGTIE